MINDSNDLILIKDITGYTSTVLLSLLYIPQIIWVYYKRDPQGLTWTFLVLGLLLTTDSIVYGVLLNEWPLVISNIIVTMCMILLMIAKCVWGRIVPKIEEVELSVEEVV